MSVQHTVSLKSWVVCTMEDTNYTDFVASALLVSYTRPHCSPSVATIWYVRTRAELCPISANTAEAAVFASKHR